MVPPLPLHELEEMLDYAENLGQEVPEIVVYYYPETNDEN
jgi:hypothetical protein